MCCAQTERLAPDTVAGCACERTPPGRLVAGADRWADRQSLPDAGFLVAPYHSSDHRSLADCWRQCVDRSGCRDNAALRVVNGAGGGDHHRVRSRSARRFDRHRCMANALARCHRITSLIHPHSGADRRPVCRIPQLGDYGAALCADTAGMPSNHGAQPDAATSHPG